MLIWWETVLAAVLGAAAWELPHFRARRRRRRKLVNDDPTFAIRYALAAHGLEPDQIVAIMRRHDDEVRETYRQTYWTVMETLAAPSREGWEISPEGTARWKPDE